MTVLRDLSMLWSLFHILILFMLLYRSRFSRIKTILYTCIAMGPIILLNMTGLILFGAGIMGKVFILTCTLPSLLFFWIVSKDKKGRFFFTFCLADTVALWIIAVTNIADFYFGGQQYILMFAGRFVLFPLTEWAAVRYLRKPYLELQDSVPGGLGDLRGNDGAVLSSAGGLREFSDSDHGQAPGTSGVCDGSGADAHDLCHHLCGLVQTASAVP